ncbi:hypothetical protein ES708_23508 [subsurface metagenome]
MISKPKYQVELEPKIQTQFTPEVSLATYESLVKDREIEEEVIKKKITVIKINMVLKGQG